MRTSRARTSSDAVQLDLFGQVEAAEQTARDLAAWSTRFERPEYRSTVERKGKIVPGLPTGIRGYLCPDPECGEIEPHAYAMRMNHGFDPNTPGSQPPNGKCMSVAQDKKYAESDGPIPHWRNQVSADWPFGVEREAHLR